MIAAWLAFATSLGPVYASGFGPADTVHQAFNRTAKKAGLGSRMLLIGCTNEGATTCRYSVTGDLSAVTTASANAKAAQSVTILFGPKSDALAFLTALGAAMMTWSPEADREERGLALSQLSGAVKNLDIREVILGRMIYRMGVEQNSGAVLLHIKPAANP
jgi:hypothetical protein